MGLNIRGAGTCRFVRKLARLAGESVTTAVAMAVREPLNRLLRHRRQNLVECLTAIGKDCAAHLNDSFRTIEHGELLYDERGLPR